MKNMEPFKKLMLKDTGPSGRFLLFSFIRRNLTALPYWDAKMSISFSWDHLFGVFAVPGVRGLR